MGTIISTQQPKRRTKLEILGDKFPFSDAEFEQLIACFRHLKSTKENEEIISPSSFLLELAKGSNSSDDPPLTHNNRMDVIKSVETSILSPNFSRSLERICFDNKSSSYGGDIISSSSSSVPPFNNKHKDDDDVELEAFLNTITCCSGRRGSRAALKMIHGCACSSTATTTAPATASRNTGTTCNPTAQEVIVLCHRLAISSEILSMRTEDDRRTEMLHQMEQQHMDHSNNSTSACSSNNNIPKGLVESLVTYASKHRQQSNGYATDYAAATAGTTAPPGTGALSSSKSNDKVQVQVQMQITLDEFLHWAESTTPTISATLSSFVHHLLFPRAPHPPSCTPFQYPNLNQQHSAFFSNTDNNNGGDSTNNTVSQLLFTYASMSPALMGSWFRIYTSDTDGLSFNRLHHSLLGYGGPTLIMIRAAGNANANVGGESSNCFGAFTGHAWKESGSFYGNSDVFLYQAEPRVGVYRPRISGGAGGNFMYCNSYARSKGYDGLAHGIGFGGTTDQPRLFITESFEQCVASSRDLTFEQGLLLPPTVSSTGSVTLQKYFEIDSLEVWGVGGDAVVQEALADRVKQRDILHANIQKARKVDKAQFLDDFKSGLIESKAFVHRDQMRGRDGGCDE